MSINRLLLIINGGILKGMFSLKIRRIREKEGSRRVRKERWFFWYLLDVLLMLFLFFLRDFRN